MTSPGSRAVFVTVFAAAYAVAYVIAVEKNYALFTYHPVLAEFGFLVERPREGLAMYWYGWLATSAIAALIAGLIASCIPEKAIRRLWPGCSWAVPVAVMCAFAYLLRGYFLR